jgi:hypothetical protein
MDLLVERNMQLVIKNNQVVATHDDHQIVSHLYPNCEVILWNKPFVDGIPGQSDPRSPEEKAQAYKDQRRVSYPSVSDQLDMIYWDQVNKTTTWQDAVTAIKNQYPKPKDSA